MAYVYERFNGVTLPTYNRQTDLAPVPARMAMVATMAGAYDSDGDERSAQQFPHTLTVRCVVTADTAALWRTALDALRALVGTRGKLYRRGDDNSLQSCVARMTAMPHTRQVANKLHIEVTLTWAQLGPWIGTVYSGPWILDGGIYFDDNYALDTSSLAVTLTSGAQAIYLPNLGNYPVRAVRITTTVSAGSLTALSIYGAGWFLAYTGSLVAGQTLVIDTGAQSVLLNGVSAYANLYLPTAHTINDWIRLLPGNNYTTVVAAGTATTTVQFEYAEAWA
jgi:hypothetical protein